MWRQRLEEEPGERATSRGFLSGDAPELTRFFRVFPEAGCILVVTGDAVLTSPTLGLSPPLEVTPSQACRFRYISYVWTRYGWRGVSLTWVFTT